MVEFHVRKSPDCTGTVDGFMLRQVGIFILIVCLSAASGCNLCCWGKRNAELTGPTDIRKSQAWCMGEDAIFQQPMGPSRSNYGMKQTCWREWQPSGPACANGSCEPNCKPGANALQPQLAPQFVPPQQKQPVPPGNPFYDDAEPLPAPNAGARRQQVPEVRMAAIPERSEFPKPFTPPPQPTHRTVATPPQPAPKSLPPRIVATMTRPSTTNPFTTLRTKPVVENSDDRLKITVSDAIDVPVSRALAPIAAPGAVAANAFSPPASAEEARETLTSLEQMFDVMPATTDRDRPGPAVVRNEFAAPSQSISIATRNSHSATKRDPEMDRRTLSALGDMMSEN